LPIGTHKFHIRACNGDGIWDREGIVYEVTEKPHYYETTLFRLIAALVLTSILALAFQLRLYQIKRHMTQRLNERVNERTRIARDLHDTLLQSFHALLLNLQTASNLLPARPEQAKQKLNRSIDQADQAITEGMDAVQDLRLSTMETNNLAVAIKAIGEELSAAGTSQNGAAVFQVGVEGTPRNLHPTIRDELYRIAVEAVRNAFRHAQARQIEVDLRYDETQFQLQVRDDGKGIDPKVLGEDGRAGHFGLPGMSERANLIGGKLSVRSEPDSGTEVELKVPATTAYATSPTGLRSWLSENLMKRLSRKGPDGKELDAKEMEERETNTKA
jgi:signal transduction histidine kinase